MDYITITDGVIGSKDTLFLSDMNLGECGVKSLAETLKGTQTKLFLSGNFIGCNGVKHLAQVLRDTQITELDLQNNNIMDEGVKYLTESLKDTQITLLDLRDNKIGGDAAQYLNEMMGNSKLKHLCLDIHFPEDGVVNNYISQTSKCGFKDTFISLNNNKIGIKSAQYLNKAFKNIAIAGLTLGKKDLEADDARYLAQAFKDIKIRELNMCSNHIMQLNGVQYLVEAFKDSQIVKLNIISELELETEGAQYLAEFLRQVKVLDLNLCEHDIGDEGIKYLVPVLENSDIMYLNISCNPITDQGAKCLSKILQNSKIIYIDLCNNNMGADGARYLADGLPNSQVTGINFVGKGRIEESHFDFHDIVFSKQMLSACISSSNDRQKEKEGLQEGIIRDCISCNANSAFRICRIFKKLVSLNPTSNEFEFIIPNEDTYPPVDFEEYAFLVRTLNNSPNSKVHILDKMCKVDYISGPYYDYDLNTMNKINEFVAILPNKFNTFFESILPNLVESFGSYNYFVNLVRQFEDLDNIVPHLLLHRVLYYVDENQEILHPYIYKMLGKYSMPSYNEQLEPNKKEEIIAYYQSHQEIDGAQEIIDLLGSVKLN